MTTPHQSQIIYDTKDVAAHFNIHSSTVRKYCDILEKSGYDFHKNEHGHRGFFDSDLLALQKLIDLKDAMTLEQASKSVVAWKTGNDIALRTTDEKQYSTQYSELLNEFRSFQEQQNAFNKELIEQLKKQNEYINNKLEERDKNLMIAMRETMETQKQIASSKTKTWWKFWE
jgi:DNA-binding transcriptional MerR regulator